MLTGLALLAGCGGNAVTYRLEPTKTCLERMGLQVADDPQGSAPNTNGRLQVDLETATVEVGFAGDAAGAEASVRRLEATEFVSSGGALAHVERARRNAVLVAIVGPGRASEGERALDRVGACLRG